MQTDSNQPLQEGCGRRLAWLGAGFVLPFYSPEFYLHAIRRPLREAILFFVLLMTAAAGLATMRVSRSIDSFGGQVVEAFQDGTVTRITIAGGETTINGQDPWIISDGDQFFFAVDTNNKLDHDTLGQYQAGILITKKLQYTFTAGREQSFDLENYNLGTGRDPLIFDKPTVEQMFASLSLAFPLVGGFTIWFWDVCLWLLFIVFSAYFLWGPISQTLPEFSFRSMLAVGIYAHLPAFTLQHILSLFGVQTLFVYTTLLLVFWIGSLWLVMREVAGQVLDARKQAPSDTPLALPPAQPLRLWPAWLGLPAIGFTAANAIYGWEFGPPWVLGSIAATIGVLLFVDSMLHRGLEEKHSPE